MTSIESQTREALRIASSKLESALSEYTAARTTLAGITGEFQTTDHKVALTFRTQSGAQGRANIILTDC